MLDALNTESDSHSANVPTRIDTIRTTGNRLAILKCLTEPNEDCGHYPPYSASSIEYMFEHGYKWYGAKKPVSISQINRTLRDLLLAGLVVRESRLDEDADRGLPQRVWYYQLASEQDSNALKKEVQKLHHAVDKAKHGSRFFTSIFDMGLPADEVPLLLARAKSLMQRTHPDKIHGFEDEFKMLQECRKWIKDGIPLPQPSHESGALKTVDVKLTKL